MIKLDKHAPTQVVKRLCRAKGKQNTAPIHTKTKTNVSPVNYMVVSLERNAQYMTPEEYISARSYLARLESEAIYHK